MNRTHAIREAWRPQTKQDLDAIQHELDEVLASPHFCNSKRYPTLLQYIVENTLAGNVDSLKERTLGVEVFDRPPTYDTSTDTVVRYTAGEIRKRLLLYYSEHGRNSAIRISLPAGSYIAEFLPAYDSHEKHGDEPNLQAADPHEPEPAALAAATDVAADPGSGTDVTAARARPRSKRVLWAAVTVLLAAATAGGWWWRNPTVQPQTALDAFWAPVLHDQRTVVVCAGSVVFAEHKYSGVITAGKDTDYSFVSMEIASAISRASSLLEHAGVATQLVSAATASLPDLREHSVILLGGYNNQWTLRLAQPLRFYLVPGQEEVIVDRMQPQYRWDRDVTLPYSSADDYALVARFRDPTIDGWVVVLAGLGRNGSEAAAQFATSPHYLELFRDRIGSGFANRNIEAVLKVSVIEGKTGAPSILAVHSW